MSTLYSDGVVNVSFVEGNVRLELVRIHRLDKDGRAQYEVENVLVLSRPAFLRFQQQVDAMVGKLIEEGVLKKNEASQPLPLSGSEGAATETSEPALAGAEDPKAAATNKNNWMKFLSAKPAH